MGKEKSGSANSGKFCSTTKPEPCFDRPRSYELLRINNLDSHLYREYASLSNMN